ncbi:MAG: hypothetical protein GX856_00915 [Gammaproteobacteria bacterium]|nr:hypothetical protein [Gammaproteobacteria bacterium]
MNPLAALGGGVLLALILFGGLQTCRLQAEKRAFAEHLKGDAEAVANAEAAARDTERALSAATITALNGLLKDQADANLRLTNLQRDRDAGAVVVRDDRKCPAPAAVPPVAGDPGGDPGAPGVYLPPDAEGRVLHLAAHADGTADRLRACQATLISWYRLINGEKAE